mmetsp:Transcript_27790/g.59419  ORF Transcript_27790/g.59419 Transcript_27790/m.59419 type:complete len:461 (+) Transcript_27790:106-1488(+)
MAATESNPIGSNQSSTKTTLSTSELLVGTRTADTECSSEYHQKQSRQQEQGEPKNRHDCTCREPSVVMLCDDENRKNDSTIDRKNNNKTLIENLRNYGWSPIMVSNAPNPPPSREQILEICRRRRQRRSESKNDDNKDDGDVVFVAAESGSSEGTIEPKESLEVQLSKCFEEVEEHEENKHFCGDGHGEKRDDDQTVKTWCRTLSWIAHKICNRMLELPENTFLPDDPSESVDLLRVFHYYAVPSKTESIGSTEHTDWGSLTVVWQDTVGGLQTYCRARNKWIDVMAPSADETHAKGRTSVKGEYPNHRWQCIVHVGDIASLVLGRTSGSREAHDTGNNSNSTCDSNTPSFPWPSPKHRVVSPVHNERASLVYFGYPPRGSSLQRIQTSLDDGWKHGSTRGQRLPLEEYYLLRDQSASGENSASSSAAVADEARDLCRTMWNLPVQDIVRLKWKQVHRDE